MNLDGYITYNAKQQTLATYTYTVEFMYRRVQAFLVQGARGRAAAWVRVGLLAALCDFIILPPTTRLSTLLQMRIAGLEKSQIKNECAQLMCSVLP